MKFYGYMSESWTSIAYFLNDCGLSTAYCIKKKIATRISNDNKYTEGLLLSIKCACKPPALENSYAKLLRNSSHDHSMTKMLRLLIT